MEQPIRPHLTITDKGKGYLIELVALKELTPRQEVEKAVLMELRDAHKLGNIPDMSGAEARAKDLFGLSHREAEVWVKQILEKFRRRGLVIEKGVMPPIKHNGIKTYTDDEIEEIAAAIWDTVHEVTATIFDRRGQAVFTRFHSLSDSQQKEGFLGLKHRIEIEGLQGYIDRKRPVWGEKATDAVIRMLEDRGLLRGKTDEYGRFRRNLALIETYHRQFHKIFRQQIQHYMNVFTGFNIVKFDKHLAVPEGISLKEWIRQKYGEDAVTLIETLISPYKE